MVTGFVCAQTSNSGYKLVFSDEFDLLNGSQPDAKKWNRAPRNNSLWARWISNINKVVFIKNGCLICRAVPNKYEKKDTAMMLTGAINSKGKFDFQYGKVLVRAKTNKMEGNFPAIWLGVKDYGIPYRYGEIDIFEVFGKDPYAYQTVHSHRSYILKKEKNKIHKKKLDVHKWHIYGMEWTKDHIIFTIDDEVTGIYEKSNNKKFLEEGQWTFDRPFYLILNQSVGKKGWHEPNLNKTYETLFDWVRVYQKM